MGSVVIGFTLGILGSLHCVVMCGPIASYIHSKSSLKSTLLLYNIGRVLTYIVLGLAVRTLGSGVEWFGYQQTLSILAGVVLVGIIAVPRLIKPRNLKLSFAPIQFMKSKLLALTSHNKNSTYLVLGAFNGLLPCGLVYVALGTTIATDSAITAALLMVGFGLGTFPLMTAVVSGFQLLPKSITSNFKFVVPVVTVFIGMLLIMRGLALDIPYVSPAVAKLSADFGITTCSPR